MAGRRNGRKLGPGDPGYRPASGIPAKGSWKQFAPGNEVRLTHGASLERYYGPVAAQLTEHLFSIPSCPTYLRDALWAFALRGWAEAEAQALLGQEWLQTLPVDKRFEAKKQGQTSPVEIVQKLEKHAANMRARVGLDPVSAARLGKSLSSTELDLARLAQGFGDDLLAEDE